nr:TPA_asm: integrase [Pimephales minnow adintovirus]
MSELMKKAYYTPSNPGSLGGKKRLKDAVLKDSGVRLSDKQVSEWLAGEDAYTLHKTAPIKYKRNRVVVYGIDTQFQADLVDMIAYAKDNDGHKYLLTCIDVFSEHAWSRVLKNKSGVEVTKAFESILKEGRVPQKLQTDKGKEFFNKHFQNLMKKHEINHFATATDLKASVVERFNRTLKSRMWRFLTATNSRRYIDVLQDIMQGYNSSYHRSIRMRPLDVSRDNEGQVFQNLYGTAKNTEKPDFKFKVGDVVRISKVRGPFTKGYEQNYTEEFFTVSSRIPRQPPVYRLRDYDGEALDGVFYGKELQKIIVSKNKSFKVEKILGQKKQGKSTLVLVKWLGWPSKFNSYVDKKTLVDLKSP